jgi:uncharacterized protein (DUF305 family)
MAFRLSLVYSLLLPLCAVSGVAQNTVPLMQPGAPGQPTKELTKPTVGTAVRALTAADVKFMQDMVMHHSQAVEMVTLMQDHTRNPLLLELGNRIKISQGDEILFMKRWLTFYEKPLEAGDAMGNSMGGMDMSKMAGMEDTPMMPGMLSPRQMTALGKARGAEFDHLFLTGMIQHHTGALSMVKDLFNAPGSGQEPQLFDFTADVVVTQQGEIDTMRNMLASEKQKEKH